MQIDSYVLSIDGKKVSYTPGQTILEVACQAGIEIPHLCYHPGVSARGFSHVCFVEIKGQKKLELSCCCLAKQDMEISTQNRAIEQARKEALSLLISDHPAECPTCVRAGECDLQDLTFFYGGGGGIAPSHQVNKDDIKQLNPLIQGHMNRCIGCQRCISFLDDVTGTGELGLFHSKKGFRVDACWEEGITSELSGNLLDLCPSGALVENSTSFKGQRWEANKIASIDVMDAMGSAIRLECREEKVLRVLPLIKSDINQYWSTDKARFSHDGLRHQRLDRPYIRKNGILEPTSWVEAFKLLVRKIVDLDPSEMAFLVGDLVEVDSVYLLRQLLDDMNVHNRDCRVEGEFVPTETREEYLFNTTFQKVEESDVCLIIGADIRYDAPLLNLRLRARYKNLADSLAIIGAPQDLSFSHTYLGSSTDILNKIAEGVHPFCKELEKAKKPILILGMDALTHGEGEGIYATARFIAERYKMVTENWNGFNVLHRAAGRVGALDVGFVPGERGHDLTDILRMAKTGQLKLLYLMGVDEISFQGLEKTFLVYQGHHGDAGAEAADLILPGATFSEKNGFYVNTEGRVQFSRRAVFPPGEAKEDWKIIRGLSEVLGHKLPYETYEDVYADLRAYSPAFRSAGSVVVSQPFKKTYDYTPIPQRDLVKEKKNYYFTNPICRASPALAMRAQPPQITRARNKK